MKSTPPKTQLIDAASLLGAVVMEHNQYAGVIVKIETILSQLLFHTDCQNEYTCDDLTQRTYIDVCDPTANMDVYALLGVEFAPLKDTVEYQEDLCPFHVGLRLWDNGVSETTTKYLGAVLTVKEPSTGFYTARTTLGNIVDSEEIYTGRVTVGRPPLTAPGVA